MRPPQKAGPIQTGGSSLSYGLAHPSGARLVFLGDDNGFDEDIARGSFTFVYGSPETLVGKPMWRSVLSSDVYVSRVVAVVVDEAHTVVHWYEFNDSVMRLVYGLVVLQGRH